MFCGHTDPACSSPAALTCLREVAQAPWYWEHFWRRTGTRPSAGASSTVMRATAVARVCAACPLSLRGQGRERCISLDPALLAPRGCLTGCSLVSCFAAHQSRVTMILFVLELEWVLSTGQDKQFAWHCSESGQRLGGYRTSAVASGLQYPLLDRIPWWELSCRLLSFMNMLGMCPCKVSAKFYLLSRSVDSDAYRLS